MFYFHKRNTVMNCYKFLKDHLFKVKAHICSTVRCLFLLYFVEVIFFYVFKSQCWAKIYLQPTVSPLSFLTRCTLYLAAFLRNNFLHTFFYVIFSILIKNVSICKFGRKKYLAFFWLDCWKIFYIQFFSCLCEYL